MFLNVIIYACAFPLSTLSVSMPVLFPHAPTQFVGARLVAPTTGKNEPNYSLVLHLRRRVGLGGRGATVRPLHDGVGSRR